METKEFEYFLPKELIAQDPVEPRDSSRLLILDRKRREIKEDIFRNVIDYLKEEDVLVLNDTKVIHARLPARKTTGGKAEIFLLKEIKGGVWEALVRPGAQIPVGGEILVGEDIRVKVLNRTQDGSRIIQFPSPSISELLLKKVGQVPLPPYIKKPISDPARYQTVYAKKKGSVAAPTAALHFTKELLNQIEDKGITIIYLTLHMGLGSFRPIREETLEEHRLPVEYYQVSESMVRKINKARKNGSRVVACGTDTVRALETSAEDGVLRHGEGNTSLFITPNYKFRVVDTLITNLHLPRSSHLVLVSTFAGKEFVFRAYRYAVEKRFRFYSFGDATMVI